MLYSACAFWILSGFVEREERDTMTFRTHGIISPRNILHSPPYYSCLFYLHDMISNLMNLWDQPKGPRGLPLVIVRLQNDRIKIAMSRTRWLGGMEKASTI